MKVKAFFKSLRLRIFLVIIAVGIVSVFVLRGAFLVYYRNNADTVAGDLRQHSLIVALIFSAVIVVIALFASSLMTKPLRRLNRSINDVQDGFEDDFTPVTKYSETEKISEACESMLQRLKILDRTQQEFVSNVSHELKTPLTSMKVLADSLVGQEDVPVELYREFMVDIGAEIERENDIIDDLLAMVRTDKSSAEMNISTVNIADMLERIRKQMAPIAQSAGVQLLLSIDRPVTADIDEVKLTLALTNLIENAVKYNHPGGWVRVTLDADYQNFFITVADNGVGIPEDAHEQIFERFYRADKSRSDEITGTGLGLSLARNAVILHHGSIRVKSTLGEGSEFTVKIPLNEVLA